MTPVIVEFLLRCHYDPAANTRDVSEAISSAADWLYSKNLILVGDSDSGIVYHTTGRGDALVKLICDTPLPESAWVNVNGKLIK